MPRRPTLDPRALRRDESHTFVPQGSFRVALLYPNRYTVAMASLGYQALWARLDALPDVACERVVLPDDVDELRRRGGALGSLETGQRLSGFDLIAVSISDELDLVGLSQALELGGLPALAEERSPTAPLVVAGGPLTQSNPRPLGPFVDAVLCGDSEGVLEPLVEAAMSAADRAQFATRLSALDGFYVPTLHGDEAPPPRVCATDALPAYARVWTPHCALPDMFLVEVSRGCPRRCAFCLSQRPRWPERRVPVDRVWERVPAEAPRVGFVGSAVSDHPGIRDLVGRAVDRGQGVGLSSLRADRLDDELVSLLVAGGMRTLTVASDASSQRLRDAIHKGIREEHLEQAAELAREHGLRGLKLYTLVGLPDETDEDIDEWIALCRRLRRRTHLTVAVNPFVPKLGTPLATAELAPKRTLESRMKRIRAGLRREGVDVRELSPRWAWVQWKLSQGGQREGHAAHEAARAGGSFSAWRRALG